MKKQYAYVCAFALLSLNALPAHCQVSATAASDNPSTSTAMALATLPAVSSPAPDATLVPTQKSYKAVTLQAQQKARKKSGKTVLIVIGVAVALAVLRILL